MYNREALYLILRELLFWQAAGLKGLDLLTEAWFGAFYYRKLIKEHRKSHF